MIKAAAHAAAKLLAKYLVALKNAFFLSLAALPLLGLKFYVHLLLTPNYQKLTQNNDVLTQ